MGQDINHETASPEYTRRKIFILDVKGVEFRFVVEMPFYIAECLQSHDWDWVGVSLRDERDRAVGASMVEGWGMDASADERLHKRIREAAVDYIYTRFKATQQDAGNEAWRVPAMLGERFR